MISASAGGRLWRDAEEASGKRMKNRTPETPERIVMTNVDGPTQSLRAPLRRAGTAHGNAPQSDRGSSRVI